MGYYGYRRSYRRYRYRSPAFGSSGSGRTTAAAGSSYGEPLDYVRDLFLNLDHATLESVFTAYRHEYGEKKAGYARRAYASWRTGSVRISRELVGRLMRLVPRFLSFEQRYRILEKLWAYYRPRHHVQLAFELKAPGDLQAALDEVRRRVDWIYQYEIPDYVRSEIEWMSDNDARIAELLIKELRAKELELSVSSLKGGVEEIFRTQAAQGSSSVAGHSSITLPCCTVRISVPAPKLSLWSRLANLFA